MNTRTREAVERSITHGYKVWRICRDYKGDCRGSADYSQGNGVRQVAGFDGIGEGHGMTKGDRT